MIRLKNNFKCFLKKHSSRPIVLISNSSWYINHYRNVLINKLISRGEKLIVIASKDKASELLSDKLIFIPWSINRRKNYNLFSFLISFIKLFLIIRALKPKIVHSHTMGPNLLLSIITFLYGIPLLISFAGGKLFKSKGIKKIIHTKIFQIIAILSCLERNRRFNFSKNKDRTKFIFQNKEDLNDFKNRFNFISRKNINLIVGSGVPSRYFKKTQSRNNWIKEKSYSSLNTITFAYSARLIKSKGILTFEKLSKHFKKDLFKVFGEKDLASVDSLTDREIKKIKRRNSNIKFHGYVKDPLLFFNSKYPILLVPSVYKEGMPRGILEAMALCIPVISSKIAPRGMIGDNFIYLANSDSIEDYLSCIHNVLNDYKNNKLRNKLLNAKLYVEKNFSEKIIANQTLELYDQFLSNKKFRSYLLDRDQKLYSDWISR